MALSLDSLLEKKDNLIVERASLLFSNQAEFSVRVVRHTYRNLFHAIIVVALCRLVKYNTRQGRQTVLDVETYCALPTSGRPTFFHAPGAMRWLKTSTLSTTPKGFAAQI
jgi:hypothetical protein